MIEFYKFGESQRKFLMLKMDLMLCLLWTICKKVVACLLDVCQDIKCKIVNIISEFTCGFFIDRVFNQTPLPLDM